MNCPDDTIAAIATPAGEGGIGIVRLSGKDAVSIADKIFNSPKGRTLKTSRSHSILYGFVINPDNGEKIDEVLVALMKAPGTYTREDVVEINCHGGTLPLRLTLQLLLKEGARPAEPGEFTKRAFLNGRIDLSQAEAVIDVIRSRTEQAERMALQQLEGRLSATAAGLRAAITGLCALLEAYIDFPEDEIETASENEITERINEIKEGLSRLLMGYEEGRFFREGASLAIVGKPNVGKSSLLNTLLQRDRAIVTDIPGTTRDVIEDYLNVKGVPLRVMDTAGIRESHDLAEIEGVRRSLKAIDGADVVMAVLDAGRGPDDADLDLLEKVRDKKTIVVINKSDIEVPDFSASPLLSSHPLILSSSAVRVSALKGNGIDDLKEKIYSTLVPQSVLNGPGGVPAEYSLITNIRHKNAVEMSLQSLQRAGENFRAKGPLEVTALFLREALGSLGEIAGAVTTDDILEKIFNEFCVGK